MFEDGFIISLPSLAQLRLAKHFLYTPCRIAPALPYPTSIDLSQVLLSDCISEYWLPISHIVQFPVCFHSFMTLDTYLKF